MSRLDELIAEMCPDGVEYKTLGEFATISRGGSFQKKDFLDSGFPCIHYGQIYTQYGLFADKTLKFISPDVAEKQRKAVKNDIVMAVTSENIEDVCKCLAWLGKDEVAVSGHTAIIHHNQNPKYLTYYFHSEMFAAQKRRLAHGTKVMEVTPDKLNDVKIPLPPLEIQREIVRILDAYSEKVSELTDRLAAELDARKKQYEYYSCQIVESASDVKMVKVRDLGKWSGGGTPSKDVPEFWEGGTIPWITSKDMKSATVYDSQLHITELATQNSTAKLLPKNVVAVVVRSGILKHTFPVAYIPIQTTINQDLKAVVAKEGVVPRYIYFVLSAYADDILAKTKKQGGTVDSLEVPKFLDYEVPLPPLAEQERIVSILDRFDKLCNDITSGLPAEIEARRRQYEHYRDRLLTFKEIPA